MRLNLFIAKSGYCSRRKADLLIKQGRVKVNGKLQKGPWISVGENDAVEVEGKPRPCEGRGKFLRPKKYIYLAFNKPKGVVTTLKDKFADKLIIDFLPSKYKGVYPVGRLDKNSSGLLILTNDGNLCYQLTHPKFGIEKEYLILIKGVFKQKDIKRAKQGLWDEGDYLKVEKVNPVRNIYRYGKTELKVIVREGKKRHLRRLFSKLGYEVIELKRIRIGGLRLGNLKEGSFAVLREEVFKERLKIPPKMVR